MQAARLQPLLLASLPGIKKFAASEPAQNPVSLQGMGFNSPGKLVSFEFCWLCQGTTSVVPLDEE
jgi:hypothetical protein